MTSRKTTIPPLLEPYLRIPSSKSSSSSSPLLILTGVLNASPHWLTTRVLRAAYGDSATAATTTAASDSNGDGNDNHDDVAVVLVSWMRDWEFWKLEARRGAGLDLARLAQDDKFAFVDGLTGLLSSPSAPSPSPSPSSPSSSSSRARPPPPPGTNTIPNRTPAPLRGPLPSRGSSAAATIPPSQPRQTTPTTATRKNIHILTSPALSHAEEIITSAISSLSSSSSSNNNNNIKNKRIVLILDSPTLVLSLSPFSPSPLSSASTATSSTLLSSLILSLRSKTTTTILSLEIDSPFLEPAKIIKSSSSTSSSTTTALPPLETEISRFIVTQAHSAKWIVGVRPLDTGVARDVSGVVRVTRGGDEDYDDDDEEEEEGENQESVRESQGNRAEQYKSSLPAEVELLYFVQSDGGVRVFERGGGEIG